MSAALAWNSKVFYCNTRIVETAVAGNLNVAAATIVGKVQSLANSG
jgi:hypothetical protein